MSIDFPGFNVLRVSAGPWFIVFNPGRLTVGDPITFGLDDRLFGPQPLPDSGTLIDAGMLQLQVRPGHQPSCRVVLQGSIWTFAGAGYRPALLAAFDEFLQRAEGLERSTLRPGAAEALRALLAPRIPATYAESLYLSHGVFSQDNPARGYFDAQPGMRLALQFEERQFVPPNAGTGLLSGFVGGAAVTTDVVSLGSGSGAPRLGLDAFFSAVRLPPVPPAAGGAGGVIDLLGATAGARHLRVCYPARSFPGADGAGTVGAAANVALLGAADLATLATATNGYYDSGNAGANLVGYFRGRTVIRAQIPLLVNGTQLCHVPVGTTVRQLLEQFRVLPRLPRIVDGNASAALNYRRYLPGLGVTELYRPDSYQKLTMADGDGPDSAGADALDFPVLAGDAMSLPSPERES
ncbi:MAG: hypothetical protein ACXVW7_11835 [Trebonia sp.]